MQNSSGDRAGVSYVRNKKQENSYLQNKTTILNVTADFPTTDILMLNFSNKNPETLPAFLSQKEKRATNCSIWGIINQATFFIFITSNSDPFLTDCPALFKTSLVISASR